MKSEARADFIKWGLVYNNGGIFMEPDAAQPNVFRDEGLKVGSAFRALRAP